MTDAIQHIINDLVDAIYAQEPQPTGHVRGKILDALGAAQDIRDFGPGGPLECPAKLTAAMTRRRT